MKEHLLQNGWRHAMHEGLIAHLGGLWHKDTEAGPSFGFFAEDIHANRYGVVHGGMMMTFIDRAFGTAARLSSGTQRSSTVTLTHQFLSPLQVGSFACITPRTVKMTARLVFMDGLLLCDDIPVLQAQGIWRISHS